ncbi:hypothetical protein DKAM_1468 [Desulfurococcus amylolyticus 1221n]|uniref:Uncharacterized protein n=1 Tax=Desulfurococcus amylolyticus (strain DSM 18924 / JCM 16383 / VKM B-2413 / 1221n) TaxID=490899 RepID=B8D6R3_DESA1|nr:hypothetical protein DKAM_1468 [Desulfurococcus amylolyticus 1221n]
MIFINIPDQLVSWWIPILTHGLNTVDSNQYSLMAGKTS